MSDYKVSVNNQMSLHDIQCVFDLFNYFSSNLQIPYIVRAQGNQGQQWSMLLAITTIYYLQLDSTSRAKFLEMTRALPTEQREKSDLQWILNQVMDEVINETNIPKSIAITQGLKENMFMTFVCMLSETPLIIVGPPGSSKVSHSCVHLLFQISWQLIVLFHVRCCQ